MTDYMEPDRIRSSSGRDALREACGSDVAVFLLEFVDGFKAALLHAAGAGTAPPVTIT